MNKLLLSLINENKIDEAGEYINALSMVEKQLCIDELINGLMGAKESKIRNTIVLILSDLKEESLVSRVIELINDEKLEGQVGTLLYALKEFDCSVYLLEIVNQIIWGNYEVRREAFYLLENMNKKVSDEVHLKAILQVNHEIEKLYEQIECLKETQEILMKLK